MTMVKDMVKETFEENGLLSTIIPNYKVREQQVELSQSIKSSIESGTPLLAEAPTGVGKSLAALVPAFEHIMATDEPVLVVTSSIILQEQYINKDIPLLEKLYGVNVNPVLIKGRNNYFCPKKVNGVQNGQMGASTTKQVQQLQELLKWAAVTESGDKSELDFVPQYQSWSQFACMDSNECTGKQCPFYSVCPYYKNRNMVITSKLVVCNYHYYFTALTNEAQMLPPGAKVVIMDEGHEINAIARDFQEIKYSMNSLKNQFDYFAKSMDIARLSSIGNTTMGLFDDMDLNAVNGTLMELFIGLSHEYKKARSRRSFLIMGEPERTRLQIYVNEHIASLKSACGAANRYLDKFGFSLESLASIADYYGEDSVEWMLVVYRTSEFLNEKAKNLEFIFAYDEKQDDGDFIFWLEPNKDQVEVKAKPTTGAGLTGPLFRNKDITPIVMSATLTTNQTFDYIRSDLGIVPVEEFPVNELTVTSPFNLEENLFWYLPKDTPAGNEEDHLSFILRQMEDIITTMKGRALCLFTSKSNLSQAEAYLKGVLPSYIKVLAQEELPRHKIVEYMKEHDHTVVLGTKSFFTGIDIQGPNLSAVLLDKIPFPMVGDPVNDYLMNQPMGFHKFSLPEATISIKQAFGRLNRTSEDKGIVAIFDGRLSTARYKNRIFNTFNFKIKATQDIEKIKGYLHESLNI